MASKRVQRDIHELDVEMAHCECLLSEALKSKPEKPPSTKQARPKSLAATCHHVVRNDVPSIAGQHTVDSVPTKTVSKVKARNGVNYFEEILDGKNSVVSVTVKTKAGKDSNLRRTSSTQILSSKGKVQENKLQNRDPPKKIEPLIRNNKKDAVPRKLPSQQDQIYGAAEKPKHLTWSKRLQEQSINLNKKSSLLENEPRRTIQSSSKFGEATQLSRYTTNFAGGFLKPGEDKPCPSEVSSISESQRSYNRNMSDIDELLYVNQNMRPNQKSSTSIRPVVSNMTTATRVSSFNSSGGDMIKDFSMINPVRLLNFLFKELDGKLESKQSVSLDTSTRQLIREIELTLKRIPADDSIKLVTGLDTPPIVVPNSPPVRDTDSQINNLQRHLEKTCTQAESAVIRVEQACESLRKDKQRLEDEMSVKQAQLDKAEQNEKDYLRAVGSLKSSLESMTKKCDDYAKTIASLTTLGEELRDENKVIPMLRAAQQKLNQRLEESTRENEALSGEVHISQLELEKLRTLVLDRDTELARVRKEVTDIHKLVADQLDSLQSPKKTDGRIDKLDREMISLNRHGWSTSESDVSGEGDQILPVTSSPTSSCNSSLVDKGVYQSWQKISNISKFEATTIQDSIYRDVGAAVETVLEGKQLTAVLRSGSTPEDSKANFQSLYLTMSDSTNVSMGQLPSSPTQELKSSRQLREDIDDLFAEIKKKTRTGVEIKLPSPPPRVSKGKNKAADVSLSSNTTIHSDNG